MLFDKDNGGGGIIGALLLLVNLSGIILLLTYCGPREGDENY